MYACIDCSWKLNQYCDTFLYTLVLLSLSLSLSLSLCLSLQVLILILARNCKLNDPLGRMFCYRTLPYWLIWENASPNPLSPSISLSGGPHLNAFVSHWLGHTWFISLYHYISLCLFYSGRGLWRSTLCSVRSLSPRLNRIYWIWRQTLSYWRTPGVFVDKSEYKSRSLPYSIKTNWLWIS